MLRKHLHMDEMLFDVEMIPSKTSVMFAPVLSLLSPHMMASVLYGKVSFSSRSRMLCKDQ